VTVDLHLNQQAYTLGDRLEAELKLTNSGVGHYFPTYVTPKVVLRIELVDPLGQVVPDSVEEEIIGRQVTLNLDREIADRRIPPKGTHTFRYLRRIGQAGLKLRVAVIVYPDEFYARFYEAKLAGRLSGIERKRLSKALEDARNSAYTLFEQEKPLFKVAL
jgi:hypothetical protein